MADPLENRLLAGRYQLVSKLGQGGMGSVWCAQDRHLRIQVAIKLLDAEIVGDEDARARFQREALSAAQLRSTHIVHITDHGIDGDTPFIAMELLEGESLAARLHRQKKLSLAETVPILSQVARALTVAHSRGIAHRDLKPDNVFLVREGDVEIVKVLDFGIAKRLDVQTYSGAVKTRTGTLLGTPYYMSPEQAHGKTLVDHRTDVWSFGVIGYECITGRRPFDEQTLAALLLAICSEAPPTPSSVALVPKGFDEWFSRATARDLDRRFSSAAEAAQALAALGTATSEGPTASLTKSSSLFARTVEAATTPLVETVKPSSVTSSGVSMKGKPFSKRVLLVALPAVAALGGMAWWLSSKPNAPEPAVSTPSVLAATPAPYPENDLKTGPVTMPSASRIAAPTLSPESPPQTAATPLVVPPASPSESPPTRAPVAASLPSITPVDVTTPSATLSSPTRSSTSDTVTKPAATKPGVTKPAAPTPEVTKAEGKPSVVATAPGPTRTPTTRTPSTPQKPKARDYAGF